MKSKLLKVTLIMGLTALASIGAKAESSSFKLAMVSDAAAANLIRDGHYSQAIDSLLTINESTDIFENLASKINLCVAYAKLSDFSKAKAACESAVKLGEMTSWKHKMAFPDLDALAHNNLGVVYHFQNKPLSAYRSFNKAKSISSHSFAQQNLISLHSVVDDNSLAAD